MLDEDIRALQSVEDPVERGKRAAELLTRHHALGRELQRVRREVIEELSQHGMSQTQISQVLGLTRGRVGQLAKSGPPPERAFFGAGPTVTVALAQKQESEYQRPAVAQEAVAAAHRLKEFVTPLELETKFEYVAPPRMINLNRDGLVVMVGPRLSPLIEQVLEADPVLRFQDDDVGWHLFDQHTRQPHRSPMDAGETGDVAYLGRLPRPDARGTFLFAAGIHAMGTQGVMHYLEDHLADIYGEIRNRRFSTLIACEFDPDSREVTTSRRLTRLYRHDMG